TGTISGTGTINANGGGSTTLDVFGTIASGVVLAIANSSILKLEGTATSAAAISGLTSGVATTLEVGGSASVTISAAQTVASGNTITMDSDASVLTDASGLTINGSLTGHGIVLANIGASSGTITASGGVLRIQGSIASMASL